GDVKTTPSSKLNQGGRGVQIEHLHFLPLDAGRLAERRWVVSPQPPNHGVLEGLRQGPMHHDDGARGQALAIVAPLRQGIAIGMRNLLRLELGKLDVAQRRHDPVLHHLAVVLGRPGADLGRHMGQPTLQVLPQRHVGGVQGSTVLDLGNQLRALDLRLSLGARKGMPTAFAIAGLRIARVNHDGPVTGRAFADVAPHFLPPLLASILSISSSLASISAAAALTSSEVAGWLPGSGSGPFVLTSNHSPRSTRRPNIFSAAASAIASRSACTNGCVSLWTISPLSVRPFLAASRSRSRRSASGSRILICAGPAFLRAMTLPPGTSRD